MTAPQTDCKEICVADSCTLLYAAKIEIQGKKIIELLADRYSVFITKKVKRECFSNIQQNEDAYDDPATTKTLISHMVREENCSECLNYLDEYCSGNDLDLFSRIHDGERENFALAFHLSLKHAKQITLLTDDWDALAAFDQVLGKHKFAIAKMLFDFIINTYQVTERIDENTANAALQDYYNLMKRADTRRPIIEKKMQWTCRLNWLEQCFSTCLNR